ncbi:MAG: efflux transporter periplasmic adaptor subunit, partial [Burkholderiales bacterium]|nr:efflux transporter periplasmic adaptor subunit [Burkholderiales bacterium]
MPIARPYHFFPVFTRGRMRWGLLLTLGLLAALLAGGGWWWQQRAGKAQGVEATKPGGRGGRFAGPAVQPVSVGEVRRENLRVRVSAIGSMGARATAVVRAKVSGELTELHFKEGD